MKCVIHVNNEPAQLLIDGRLMIIPPNELFEVPELRGMDINASGRFEYVMPDHYVMNKIIEQAWYHGIVEVPMVKDKTGVHADVQPALVRAREALEMAEDRILTRYVTDQQERVTKEGKAAMAPGGRVLAIIDKRGIDLKKEFNIDPPGYKLDKMHDRENKLNAVEQENAELRANMKKMQAQLDRLEKAAK